MHRVWPSLVLSLVGVAACGTGPPTVPPEADDWGPVVMLRDLTDTTSTGRPEGGWYVTPIHAVLLPDGDVLLTGWGRRDPLQCGVGGTRSFGITFRIDPAELPDGTADDAPGPRPTYAVTPIDEAPAPETDMLYCAGHTHLADGRVFYTGGSRYEGLGTPAEVEWGLDYARIYDADAGVFSRLPDPMTGGPRSGPGVRWYPTNTRLDNGDILVTGGFVRYGGIDYANLSVERLTGAGDGPEAGSWRQIVGHGEGLPDMAPAALDYTHVYLLPEPASAGGRSFDAAMLGGRGSLLLFDSSGDGASAFHRPAGHDRGFTASGASGALLPDGDLLALGSEAGPQASRLSRYDVAADRWDHVDTGIGRYHPTAVLLPDATVLFMNGQSLGPTDGDSRRPQVYDPATGSLQTQPPWPGDDRERGYHSFALLLRDGRVLIGGGTHGPEYHVACERTDLRIYTPPYLLRGPRPTTAVESLDLQIGGPSVTLDVGGAPLGESGAVVLMALGAATHAFDQSQRYVPLTTARTGSGVLEIQPPSSGRRAPPGPYMLFLVSDRGVPSIGVPTRLRL